MTKERLTRSKIWWEVATVALTVLCAGARPCAGQAAGAKELPLVRVLSTGGTIAGRGSSTTDLSNYKSGSVRGDALVNAVPEIKQVARVEVEEIANVSSSDITLDNWLTIARRINTIFADDPKVAGVVVTHGTNTLEETAYFLNLTVKSDRPVVIVGSMRPGTAISADGPLNLLNAVRTAASPGAKGQGVLVVLNDEINGARDVTKTNTYRVETFRAPELGLLGYVDEDKVSFYRASTRRHTLNSEFDVSAVKVLPTVDIINSYVGAGTALLRTLFTSGVQGIVLAGTGAGAISTSEMSAIKQLQKSFADRGPVIVRSSRVGSGRVISRDTYDEMGLVPADNLSPQKARILLMLALTRTKELSEIKRMFLEY